MKSLPLDEIKLHICVFFPEPPCTYAHNRLVNVNRIANFKLWSGITLTCVHTSKDQKINPKFCTKL